MREASLLHHMRVGLHLLQAFNLCSSSASHFCFITTACLRIMFLMSSV